MNIWDSVHRSLDKASKEAGRIARWQRLRSQIEKVTRQISTQEDALLRQVMNLFLAGQMTQAELLPLCRELINLQQQLSLAQSELQILQNQGPLPPHAGGQQDINAPHIPTTPATIAGLNAAAPEYQPFDATMPATPPPPPPPGMDLQTLHAQETIMSTLPATPVADASTISSQETIFMQEGAAIQPTERENIRPTGEGQQWAYKQHCPKCNIETLPGHYYCQNCGTALILQENSYQPTTRTNASPYQANQETVYAPAENNESLRAASPLSGEEGAATIYGELPPLPPHASSEEKDGGQ